MLESFPFLLFISSFFFETPPTFAQCSARGGSLIEISRPNSLFTLKVLFRFHLPITPRTAIMIAIINIVSLSLLPCPDPATRRLMRADADPMPARRDITSCRVLMLWPVNVKAMGSDGRGVTGSSRATPTLFVFVVVVVVLFLFLEDGRIGHFARKFHLQAGGWILHSVGRLFEALCVASFVFFALESDCVVDRPPPPPPPPPLWRPWFKRWDCT